MSEWYCVKTRDSGQRAWAARGVLARARDGGHKAAMPIQRPTILLVEDEANIAETVLYALQTEGFAPLWKTTGRDALAALQSQPVALVVLDVGLPDMSGFDVCRDIRRHHNVPVIFLTARSDEVDRIVGLELGADDYVAKPFSPRELTARVRAVLRRSNDGSSPAAGPTRPGSMTRRAAASAITAGRSTSRATNTGCWARCSRSPAVCSAATS